MTPILAIFVKISFLPLGGSGGPKFFLIETSFVPFNAKFRAPVKNWVRRQSQFLTVFFLKSCFWQYLAEYRGQIQQATVVLSTSCRRVVYVETFRRRLF